MDVVPEGGMKRELRRWRVKSWVMASGLVLASLPSAMLLASCSSDAPAGSQAAAGSPSGMPVPAPGPSTSDSTMTAIGATPSNPTPPSTVDAQASGEAIGGGSGAMPMPTNSPGATPETPLGDAGVGIIGDEGMSGDSADGAAGSGGAAPGEVAVGPCTRELLGEVTDLYFVALAAHDPGMLPLADNVKFTENGATRELGAGLWEGAGTLVYKHSALDTASCSSVSESVVPEGDIDLPVGLRLQLSGQQITEIESIVARPGDYTALGSPFRSDTSGIMQGPSVGWEESVPADDRTPRAEIEAWYDKYYNTFPAGGCNIADDCRRRENGGGNFDCSFGLQCSMGGGGGFPLTIEPRDLVIVDDERGIGVGFTMWDGHTDFHMTKWYGGEIHAVHAILSKADNPGW